MWSHGWSAKRPDRVLPDGPRSVSPPVVSSASEMSDERSSTTPRMTELCFFRAFVPPPSGGELRCYHLYKNLGRYYRIDLVTPTNPFGPPETVPLADNVV